MFTLLSYVERSNRQHAGQVCKIHPSSTWLYSLVCGTEPDWQAATATDVEALPSQKRLWRFAWWSQRTALTGKWWSDGNSGWRY